MSLDTKAKRKCAITIPVLAGWPDPDSTISQGDRAQSSNMYCGIAVQIIASSDWCPVQDHSPSWVQNSDDSDSWVPVQDQSRL